MVDNVKKVRVVYGVDVGHGESAGCWAVLRDNVGNLIEKPEIKVLNVQNNAPKIYSTLTYKNGYAMIGGIPDVNVNAFFKRSPVEWDKIAPNSGKSYREMMKDFIGNLVMCLMNSDVNPTVGSYAKDEIVLFVGCPSDITWINPTSRTAYEKLISEATGIKNVHVVAESTAAIFSIIRNNASKKIDPKKGVAVFDFGSSTADFTYVSLGEVLAELSWTLGASAIEANIVEKALYDELGLDPEEVWDGDLIARQLEVRRDIKEAWYGDNNTPGHIKTHPDGISKTISYTQSDGFGNAKTRTTKKGVVLHETNFKAFSLDKDFMDDVIMNMPVPNVKEKGELVDPSGSASWHELCRRFVTKCYNLMKNNNLSCKTVILTGGASRMDFIMDICKSVFKDEAEIYRDEQPSYCICKGLCQIAINKWRIDDVIAHEKQTVRAEADKALAVYTNAVQNKITDYIFDSMLKVFKDLPSGIIVADFQKRVENYFAKNLNENTVANLVSEYFTTMNESVTKSVVDASLRAASGFYSSDIDRMSFAISMDMTKAIKMDGIRIGGAVIDAAVIAGKLRKAIGEISAIISFCLIWTVLFNVPVVGPLLSGLAIIAYYLIKDWIINNPDTKIKDVDKTAAMLNKPKKKDHIKKDIHDSAAKDCTEKIIAAQFSEGYADFYNGVNDMVDKAVRIVALEHFETEIRG